MESGLNEDWAKKALDELFNLTTTYRSSASYHELFKFIVRFRSYSPYNAMLIHLQRSGASFVAPASRWLRDYQRAIRPGANPIVILQPFGPVMFVYDVADTLPLPDAMPLPKEIYSPFEVRGGKIGKEFEITVQNAKRDGILVHLERAGSQSAGSIRSTTRGGSIPFLVRKKPKEEHVMVPIKYDLLVNSAHPREVQYATLAHELGHLYLGHLGSPNKNWWPDRGKLDFSSREFEAESVSYLVCLRLGLDTPSEKYLNGYLSKKKEVPQISLEAVLRAAGLIESMGLSRMKPRNYG